ncbi:MAG: hypothetical protein IID37_03135 [Planctomycetes bacterium]|nr:hypothetical protein [Planctomycetota bacterium]
MTRIVDGLLAHAGGAETGLNLGGMFMLAMSVLLVCGLVVFCAVRIMREKAAGGHVHAPLDSDTRDTD